MSCEEWEAGTLTLPASAVEGVRKSVLAAHNQRLTDKSQSASSSETHFESEATIVFRNNQVFYSSGEGNHQTEYARACPNVVALFRELRSIAWEPETGGSIMGSNEFNEEQDGEPYVVESFGPR